MDDIVQDALQEIYDQRGRLTPALVVDEARDETHPLHDRFEWDDVIAGEAYRRTQAGALIRSVKVVYDKTDAGEEKAVRKYHAVRRDQHHEYEPIEEIAANPQTREMVLEAMYAEWQAFKERYEHLEEFFELVKNEAAV